MRFFIIIKQESLFWIKMQQQNQSKYLLYDRLTHIQKNQLEQIPQKIKQFVQKHKGKGKVITFLTSGGTSVPLQSNTVRFIQNFSTGMRGSSIAEIILEQGYPLIFFYRDKSYLPYQKIRASEAILSQSDKLMQELVKCRQKYLLRKDQMLLLPFSSIYYYLNGLLTIKPCLPAHSILILCAAVSDFIPSSLPTHKITTTQSISLSLQNSPKILGLMVSSQHLCVSFKLQTDKDKIHQRMEWALKKYGVDLVIGNLLGNKSWIHIQYNQDRFNTKSYQQFHSNIEYNIWQQVIKAHQLLFAQ